MRVLTILMLLCPLVSRAQIAVTVKPEWTEGWSSTLLNTKEFCRIDLPHNSPDAIRDEVFDDALIRSIGKALGLSEEGVSSVRVFKDPEKQNDEWRKYFLDFCWQKNHNAESETLLKALQAYIAARSEGRTKESMQASITNLTPLAEIKDAGIRAIVEKYPLTPASLLQKSKSDNSKRTVTHGVSLGSGKETIETIKLKGMSSYILIDDDICWLYEVDFRADDGTVFSVRSEKHDAKGYDEKYAKVFKQVEAEVKKEMKKEGIKGLGSRPSSWWRKKEKLEKRGILWRTPSELNPGTCYD